MDDTLKVDRQSSPDYDLYAALMLSNLLDSEQDVKEKQQQQENSLLVQPPSQVKHEAKQEDAEEEQEQINHDVIWVPADKHPQIAPTEFANFIKTHGANTPLRKSSSLRRRKSILSQSLSVKSTRLPSNSNDNIEEEGVGEESELNRTLSEKKRIFLKKVMNDSEKLKAIDTHVFDRNSTSIDDSRIIAPRTDKSLLRRSAFSARGRNRKSLQSEDRQQTKQKRSISQRNSSSSSSIESTLSTKDKTWDKSNGGISLYDQPVNMSEWIDLGSASLFDSTSNEDSQRGILSRVHDAESQLLTHQQEEEEEEKEEEVEKEAKYVPIKQQDGPKRPSIVRSSTTEIIKIPATPLVAENSSRPAKSEKRTSWLSGLFQTAAAAADNTNNSNKKNKKETTSALSGLATLFTRSLSIKSNNTNLSNNTTITTTTNDTLTTKKLQQNLQQKKKRSSRLEIPPPSERTFFNSNRLPLHVERAIYRLSHMKLADPKRSLRQQVLISNLMFWYLSIQQQQQQQQNDFNQQQQQLVVMAPAQIAKTVQIDKDQDMIPIQQKVTATNKMARFIHSAKKRKSEVAQFVSSTYPPIVNNNEFISTATKKNVQFNLAPILYHHQPQQEEEEEKEEEEEEEGVEEDENVPLSHFQHY